LKTGPTRGTCGDATIAARGRTRGYTNGAMTNHRAFARQGRRLLLPVGAGLIALLAAGCDRSTGAAQAGPQEADGDGPADFGAFLTWAEERLREPVPEVELPTPAPRTEPKWPVVRLDDLRAVRKARRQSGWQPTQESQEALAALGPFRSEQPSASFRVRAARSPTRDGQQAIELGIGGFRVRCERVGAIELELRVPFGREVTLAWGKAGQIVVPLSTNDDFETVRVLTDGFAEWEGPLEAITLVTDGPGQPGAVIEIRALRFLPRSNAYTEAMGVKRVRLGSELRTALYMHAPGAITYEDVELPLDARLQVGLGAVSQADRSADVAATAGAQFTITVARQGAEEVVLRETIAPTEQWTDFSASLKKWSGQDVTITLRCSSKAPGAVAFWANPILYEPADDAPIFVVYLIDTLAGEHISLLGYPRQTMPRLTALAEQGAWFPAMYSNSSRTIESIPDLMLSMPTERHGVHHNSTAAQPELDTLAELLRGQGFATVSFCTNVNAGPRQGMDQGFDTFIDKIGYWWTGGDRTVPLDEAMRWVETHRERPMFLYVHTAEPHAPYAPPEGYQGRFDPDYDGDIDGTYNRATTFRNIRNPQAQLRDLQHVAALYDEELLYADARLGMFLDRLGQAGVTPRLDVLVTSDHGEEFLQHGTWEHGLNVHNEQTRVPLVAFGRSVRPQGRIEAPAQVMDILPTVLDLLGAAPPPRPLGGVSLAPLLRGEGQGPAERLLYGSNHNYRIERNLIEYYVIEPGAWKLLYGSRPVPSTSGAESRWALYDLKQDPTERVSVLSEHPDVARRLIDAVLRWRRDNPPYARTPDVTVIDAAQIRDLQNLGYVGGAHDDHDHEPPEQPREASPAGPASQPSEEPPPE